MEKKSWILLINQIGILFNRKTPSFWSWSKINWRKKFKVKGILLIEKKLFFPSKEKKKIIIEKYEKNIKKGPYVSASYHGRTNERTNGQTFLFFFAFP